MFTPQSSVLQKYINDIYGINCTILFLGNQEGTLDVLLNVVEITDKVKATNFFSILEETRDELADFDDECGAKLEQVPHHSAKESPPYALHFGKSAWGAFYRKIKLVIEEEKEKTINPQSFIVSNFTFYGQQLIAITQKSLGMLNNTILKK